MNMAFLMKVAWGILTRSDELWVKVLLSKYLRKTDMGYIPARSSGFSAAWRGILKAGPILNNGIQWAIRNGRLTKFWTDKWLDSGLILIDHALNIQGVSSDSCVADFVLDCGSWNTTLISSCLPAHIAIQVLGMTPPDGQLGMDSVAWGLEPSGKFTIKSAYLLLKDLHDETANLRWKAVWRWQGPNNIRHFLWLASHNRLLTNEERGRQHHTTQVFCSFCSSHTESCVHILRDCTFAHQFWSKVLPQVITGHELSKVWSVWLDEHIRYQELCNRQWEVTLHHIYREANYAADYLANLGHSFIFGFHIVNLPNGGLSHWLCYDVIGVSLPRSVSIKTNI
ncbi:Putative ribonuclease H protein At1g65750 [Linum grandiflorum]